MLSGELTGKKLALFRDHWRALHGMLDIQGAAICAVKGKTGAGCSAAYLQSLASAPK